MNPREALLWLVLAALAIGVELLVERDWRVPR